MMKTFSVRTHSRTELVDMTAEVQSAVASLGVDDGVCTVFVPHTTAGVTVNENADPDVKRDILMALGKLIPDDPAFSHAEGNSDAHLKTLVTGSSLTLMIAGGRLELGSWGGVYFCEYDGPRRRRLLVTIQGVDEGGEAILY